MKYSTIDEIIDYSYRAKNLILQNQKIMGYISDNPDIDLDGEEMEVYEKQVKDHNYVDETSLTANAYVCVETEVANLDSTSMKSMLVHVHIICSRGYMDMNPRKFPGVKGNRRDNIAREINNILNENIDFGVGELLLVGATITSVPTGYTARLLTYKVPAFARS